MILKNPLSFKTSILIVSLLMTISVYSQQKLNTKFEILSVEGSVRPWAWDIENFSDVAIQLDAEVKKEGKYSLRMSSDKVENYQFLSHTQVPFSLVNSELKLEGFIKTQDISDSVFLELGYGTGMLPSEYKFYSEMSQVLSGTNDWTLCNAKIAVPDSADFVFITVNIKGKGTCWFDDLSLSQNGKELSELPLGNPFTSKQLKWIERKSSPMKTHEPDANGDLMNSDFSDLKPLKKAVKNTRIIALGEATHGTSEFFEMKHRVLEFAVKELGVRIFALEDNQLIVAGVNKYVQGGNGTARSAMNGLFSISQNEEVHNMIQWARDYNDVHPDDKIQFVGFDMQYGQVALDSLTNFTKQYLPNLVEPIEKLLSDLTENISTMYQATDTQKQKWNADAKEVFTLVSRQEETLRSQYPNREFELAFGIQYARLLAQFTENSVLGHQSLYRDVAMSENVSWILDHYAPNSKMLIWAHDYHISLGEHEDNSKNIYSGISMGSHLRRKYGADYKAFSLATYEGTYWGQMDYMKFDQLECPLYQSPKATLDFALHAACLAFKTNTLFFDLSKSRSKDWLNCMRATRFANHVNIDFGYFAEYSVPFQFDGVIFINTSSAARSYVRN